jgi:hypothetical protein
MLFSIELNTRENFTNVIRCSGLCKSQGHFTVNILAKGLGSKQKGKIGGTIDKYKRADLASMKHRAWRSRSTLSSPRDPWW